MNIPNRRTVEWWAQAIAEKWQENVSSIFDVARMLETARAELSTPEWVELYKDRLKVGKAMASKLISIAEDEHGNLSEVSYRKLPPSWPTLYQLAKLTPEQFQVGMESGIIHAGMEQKDIAQLKPKKEKSPKPTAPAASPTLPKSTLPLDEVIEVEVERLLVSNLPDIDDARRSEFFGRLRSLIDHLEDVIARKKEAA